jgi:hypothetical protein
MSAAGSGPSLRGRGRRDDVLVNELANGEDDLTSPSWLAFPRDQRAAPLSVAFEQVLADDQPLDLVRALADDHERSVAIEPLDAPRRELARRSNDGHGVNGGTLSRLGCVKLGHAGFEIAALATVLHRGGPVRDEASGLDLRRNVREGEGRRVGDRRPAASSRAD